MRLVSDEWTISREVSFPIHFMSDAGRIYCMVSAMVTLK